MISNLQLRCDLLKELRHPKSQSWLADRLDTSKTQIHRWESGSSHMKWADFVKICQIRHRNLKQSIQGLTIGTIDSTESPAELIKFLVSSSCNTNQLAAKLGRSRYTVSKWFNGKAEPSLDDVICAFISFKPMLLSPFLLPIVEPSFVESHKEIFQQGKLENEITYDFPVVSLILRSFELKEYIEAETHIDGYVSRKTGISMEEEKRLLTLLENSGLIQKVDNKFHVLSHSNDTRGNVEGNKQIRKYWMNRAVEHIGSPKAPSDQSMFGHNVFSVGPTAFSEIKRLYINFFEDVRTVVAQDRVTPEILTVLSIQIFDPSAKKV